MTPKFNLRIRTLTTPDSYRLGLSESEVAAFLRDHTRVGGYAVLVYPEGSKIGMMREEWARGVRRP